MMEGVEQLPVPPAPFMSGPYGEPRTIQDFQDRAVITGEQGVRIEDNVGYGAGRTRVEYQGFELEADRMVIDFISGEIQAEGNVVYRGQQEFIKASSGRFNLVANEGAAYNVDGQAGNTYFRAEWEDDEPGPAFRQIDENQSIFRTSYFTTSAFPVPQYYIRASEVILIKDRRAYFRNPVLVVRGIPMFWLPFYSRNLGEGSPWSNEFGYNSDLGAYFRLGYRYTHRVQTPEWEDPSTYETKSHGVADWHLDLMSDRGTGLGVRYNYQFDYYRHTGFLQLYGLRDNKREIDDSWPDDDDSEVRRARDEAVKFAEENELPIPPEEDYKDGDSIENRWVYRHKHFSELRDDLVLQIDIDQASDPDIYYDVLDLFSPMNSYERGRLYERHMKGALTYRQPDYIARILLEHRERLGRDIYLDQTDPWADDLNFDPDPVYTDADDDTDDEGISAGRFGTVSKNIKLRYATRMLNLYSTPLYYRFQANAFDSLDSGLNSLDWKDDTRVRGGDLYGAVTHRLRIGRRTTWMNTVGVGAAYYERDSDRLVTREDFYSGDVTDEFLDPPDPATNIPPDGRWVRVRNAKFRDPSTLILGQSPTDASLKDVEDAYFFADYTSRLNHRFTDFLDGYIKYFVRQGTDDSLGEFYESIGNQEARDDIYDFYTDKHYIEGGLNFYLLYPNLRSSIIARENLQRGDDIYANEQIRYVGYNIGYTNPTQEFNADFSIGYDERQIRDPDDINEFQQPGLNGSLLLSYIPWHARYWASLNITGTHKLEEDPVFRDVRERQRFDEEETEFIISPTIGKAFGPKYRVQLSGSYNTRWENLDSIKITLIRDLADAELGLQLGLRNRNINPDDDDFEDTNGDGIIDESEADPNERDTEYEYDIRASLRFKINQDQPGLGQRSITTLADLRREAQYVR